MTVVSGSTVRVYSRGLELSPLPSFFGASHIRRLKPMAVMVHVSLAANAEGEARGGRRARTVGGAPAGRASGLSDWSSSDCRILRVIDGEWALLLPELPRRDRCRGSSGGVDGMKHARRVSFQRGGSQAALTDRADQLLAQPFDELPSGLNVHHVQPVLGGIAS